MAEYLRPLDARLAVSAEQDDEVLLVLRPDMYATYRGDIIRLDQELARVTDFRPVDIGIFAIDVQRGYASTAARAHHAGATCSIVGVEVPHG